MFLKYFKITLLSICCSCVSNIVADDAVDCTSEEIVTSIFNNPIELQHNGTIRLYENVQINDISATTNNDFDRIYIDARLELNPTNGTKNMVIFTTEYFAHYAEEQSAGRITLKITIACDMGRERTLIFFQPIKEGNYFSPKFSKDIYEIAMPTPIFKGFDLTIFTEVSAKDDDLTNNQILFTSENSELYHIAVGTRSNTSTDGKTYYANITLTRIYLSLLNDLTIQITATDNGTPPLSSNATVVVRADTINSLPATPQFQHSFFNATLDANLSLEPLQVTLLAQTYSREVNFSKSGEDQHLFSLNNTDNVVQIVLTNPLNISDVMGKRHLHFEIKAEHRNLVDHGRTAIFIDIPDIKENFHFGQSLYEGFIDSSHTNLTIDEIIFNQNAYNQEVTFQLSGDKMELFSLEQIDNRLKLTLSNQSLIENWDNITFLTLEIRATLSELYATTGIFVRLPMTNLALSEKRLEFEKPLYIGTINEQALQIEAIHLFTENFDSNQTKFLLSGNYSEAFDIIFKNNTVGLHLNNTLAATELMKEVKIYIILTASIDNFKRHASIVFETGRLVNPPTAEVFTKPLYNGNIEQNVNGTQVLNLESINIKDGYEATQFDFTIKTDDDANFTIDVDVTNNRLNLKLFHPLSAEKLAEKTHIDLLIVAVQILNPDVNSTVVIIIGLPKIECTTSAPEFSFFPQFDNTEYIIAAQPNQVGTLWQVTASIHGSNASISYSLSVENEHLQKRMTINAKTGELVLLSFVSPGSYFFRISAENSETSDKTNVNARLNVESGFQCAGENLFNNVANALIIKYIKEEQQYANVMNMTVGNCTFQIAEMYPNDKTYVYINESTSMLSTIAIDREDGVFANMVEPQIRVSLRLICNLTKENQTLTRKRRDVLHDSTFNNYSLVLTDDISFSKDLTILSLIIVDINDNSPEFVYPIGPTYLGYPERDICFELFPQYLTQIKASDKDLGLNAKIRYSMRPNEHFSIDSINGDIYPKVNALISEEYTELIVLAADREGAQDGLRTGAVIFVRRLSANYYSLLTFGGSGSKILEDALMHLSNKTEYSITVVKHATIPGKSNVNESNKIGKRFSRALEDSDIIQKAWVYAFQRSEPVNCEVFEDKISAISDAVVVESYEAVGLVSNQNIVTKPDDSKTEYTAYMVAIITLVIISVISIGILIWRLYLEKCRFANGASSKEHCTTNSTTKCADDISFLYSTTIDTCNMDSHLPTLNEDNCDCNVPNASSAGVNSTCANEEETHKVKFNDCVEHIEVMDHCSERF